MSWPNPDDAKNRSFRIEIVLAMSSCRHAHKRRGLDGLRQAPSPREALLDFCQSTYEAAAELDKWDRAELGTQGVASPGVILPDPGRRA